MISHLSSFRNSHAFATPLFLNVRLPAFATFLLSQPHAFATIFLLSQPFCLFANVKKSSFRNKVLVSQQKSPRFATVFLVSQPSPRFATTKSSFRNNFPRFATLSKWKWGASPKVTISSNSGKRPIMIPKFLQNIYWYKKNPKCTAGHFVEFFAENLYREVIWPKNRLLASVFRLNPLLPIWRHLKVQKRPL